jgi:hypothetical protein
MRTTTPRHLAFALIAAMALGGCGRVSSTAPLPPAPSMAPAALSADPLDVMPTTPIGAPMAGLTPGVAAGVMPGAGCEALAGCDVHAMLVVGDVQKKKVGFLWRKLRVTGKVTNRGAAALDGEVMVRFKKDGEVVQSEYVAVAALAPGQSKTFEHSSSVAADDVEVTSRAL